MPRRTPKLAPGQLTLVSGSEPPVGQNAGIPLSWEHRVNIGNALRGKPGSGANRRGRNNHSAKGFCLRDPQGKRRTGKNLKQFAERNQLDYDGLRAVLDGRLCSYKQWTKWKGGKKKRTYALRSPPPDLTEYEVENLSAYAAEWELDATCLSRVCRGQLSHHKGWTWNPPKPPKVRKFRLLSPQNEWVEGENLRQFARMRGLDSTALTKVLQGKQTHHQGWRKENVPWVARRSICTYQLINPAGGLVQGENLEALCQQFGLQHSSMWEVNEGNQAEHRGWRKATAAEAPEL